MIGFCTQNSSPIEQQEELIVEKPELKTDTLCVICEFTLNLAAKYLSQNATEPEIEKWLEYVCNTEMPKPIRNECNTFIQAYGPVVISLLLKQVNPDKICQTIGACPKVTMPSQQGQVDVLASSLERHLKTRKELNEEKKNKMKFELKLEQQNVNAANTSCVMCEFVLNVLQQYVSLNSTEVIF